nr:C40 family peptidase [Sciscionella marina]
MAAIFVVIIASVATITPVIANTSTTSSLTCTTTDTAPADGKPKHSVPGYGPEQLHNAALIIGVGKQLHIPVKGWVVAIATAIQESGLRNLEYGDRDSLGLFQQRPSMGWGTRNQITTPTYAATQFYRHLKATPGWQHMSVNDAAQAVQRSGTPNAYAQHEKTAHTVVAAVSGSRCTSTPTTGTGACANIQAPTPAAMAAINYACGQRGLPYVWGGNGPEHGDTGFDCSGLTQAAYHAAGINLPRTARAQHDTGHPVPPGQPLLPGDLVYYGNDTNIHHVGLYLGNRKMINAPDYRQPVQISPYRHPGDDYYGASRPSK